MNGTFLFLGTGASSGVPLLGCKCAVCQSTNPHNQRLRPSGLLRIQDKIILIDVGPDFRQQALRASIEHLDGMLLTHTHYDHIAGVDELRSINYRQKKPFPCLLSKESFEDLKKRYDYMFKERKEGESYAAALNCQVLPSSHGEIDFIGLKIGYTTFEQAKMKVTGFRLGNFAYISDIRKYSEDIFSFLQGVDILILSALRAGPSEVHLSFAEAVEFSKKAGAKQTWLTHLSHATDHEEICRSLPPNVQPGYDGLEIRL